MLDHKQDELLDVIKVLHETIWEQRLSHREIDAWLANFSDDEERHIALHLLANFTYFGLVEMRELLRSLYRDLYRYPIIERIRRANSNSFDPTIVEAVFADALRKTRFLGMGNPSESGQHLLYYFRQENALPKTLFVNAHEVFAREAGSGNSVLRAPDVDHYVFIDDLCGSGTQALQYSRDVVEEILRLKPSAIVDYVVLVGTDYGLQVVRKNARFSNVKAVFELDGSFKAFDTQSRYYLESEQAARERAKGLASEYGQRLMPQHPLGYKDSQLLMGFCHNIPDNTLPVVWSEQDGWCPAFRRYHKIYS